MDGYELGLVIHTNDKANLKVFEATGTVRAGRLIVKQYLCSRYEEADVLLKEAISQAHEPFPIWSILREVVLDQIPQDKERRFTVNYIIEKFVSDVPADVVTSNERTGEYSGLSKYEMGTLLYRNPTSDVEVWTARSKGKEVVVKKSELFRRVNDANSMVMEGVVQAHAKHVHNTKLSDIAVIPEEQRFRLCLVIERLNKDVRKELEDRQAQKTPYSEEELLKIMLQVTSGLIHTKAKNIAHRDIKPDNIFIGMDGNYKVGDFGSAFVKQQAKRERVGINLEVVGQRQYETLINEGAGTLPYLSPEMKELLKGNEAEVNPYASDIYSFGVTMLELAKLNYPIKIANKSGEQLTREIKREIDSTHYSDFLKQVLEKMLKVEFRDRCIAEEAYLSVGTHCGHFELKGKDDLDSMMPPQLVMEEEQTKAETLSLETQGDSAELGTAYHRLANIYRAQKKFEKALHFGERAVEVRQIVLGEHHHDVAASYIGLGLVYYSMGRLAEAEEYHKKALSIRIAALGENHIDVAASYNNLGNVYYSMGRLAEAEEYYKKALSIRIAALGENHIDVAASYTNLGNVNKSKFFRVNTYDYSEKAQIINTAFELNNINFASSSTFSRNCYKTMCYLIYAEKYYQKALALTVSTFGENHMDVSTILFSLGDTNKAFGRIAAFQSYYFRASNVKKLL